MVEDIDRKNHDEPALFALLNAARLGGGTVLLTSRLPAGALDVKLPDLRSRLRAATAVELRAPDESLLVGVIMKVAADRQIELDPRVVEFALPRMERSFEAASDFVRRLDQASLAGKLRIGRSLAQRILEEMALETNRAS
ncbi:DnaA/Hda family protein [Aureimonas sp. Leaf324]|uniref:HdaA/DnaA family protein n=1 Tax=Aureimonas sp. Leaf324 TaxID=1736336 RepID=UPI001FCD95AA|nr:DnaA/Hda family protein [Aureimonas sp. Leaf324]